MKSKDLNTSRALSEALKPLVRVCLNLGVPSLDLERIVRETFILEAFKHLPKHPKSGSPPTAHKVSLATGLSRTLVATVKKQGALAPSKKGERPWGLPAAARVIEGWSTDPKFQTSGGSPLDLPVKPLSGKRSFHELVDKYAPSTHQGALLKELVRRGQVEVLEGDLVRFKRASARKAGLSAVALHDASKRLGRIGQTLYQTLQDEKVSSVAEETKPVRLTPAQLALLMPRIERRVVAFVKSIESELQTAYRVEDAADAKEFGVGIYSWDE